MNILFLSHRIPYPPDKGDKIRSFNEIKYLSKKNNIYLGTVLEHESDIEFVEALKKYCREVHAVFFERRIKLFKNLFHRLPFSVVNFYDKGLQEYVDKTLKEKQIDVVICFCSSMAEYIFKTPLFKEKKMGIIKLIMDYIDLDSDKWLQYATYARLPVNLLYKIENKRLFKYEIKVNKTFNHSIFVSQREVDVFKKLYPEVKNIHIISNGVDHDYFSPKQKQNPSQFATRNSRPILIFTGVMDYFANEDGVNWFCKNIFPKIRSEVPNIQFYIVGNKPTNLVWSLTEIDGVTVTGYVNDIREYYWMADICVIPLRIARGLQNKVLEAMATGNAVIATSNATDGIICHNKKDIIIENDKDKFAKEVISLLKDKYRREEIGRNAVENIRQNYSWEENLKGFDDLLQTK